MVNRGSYVNAQRRGRSGFRSEIGNCPLLHAHLLLESQLSQLSSAFFSPTYPFYHIKLTLHSYSSNQHAFDQRFPQGRCRCLPARLRQEASHRAGRQDYHRVQADQGLHCRVP